MTLLTSTRNLSSKETSRPREVGRFFWEEGISGENALGRPQQRTLEKAVYMKDFVSPSFSMDFSRGGVTLHPLTSSSLHTNRIKIRSLYVCTSYFYVLSKLRRWKEPPRRSSTRETPRRGKGIQNTMTRQLPLVKGEDISVCLDGELRGRGPLNPRVTVIYRYLNYTEISLNFYRSHHLIVYFYV